MELDGSRVPDFVALREVGRGRGGCTRLAGRDTLGCPTWRWRIRGGEGGGGSGVAADGPWRLADRCRDRGGSSAVTGGAVM